MRMSGARRSELVQTQERDSFLQGFQKDLPADAEAEPPDVDSGLDEVLCVLTWGGLEKAR